LNFVEMRFRDGLPGDAVERGVEDILKRHHHVKDFSIYNMEKWVQSKKVFTDTTTYLLGAIGLVSLIVGGIGVMNIMLVSVSERARERHKNGGGRAPIRRAGPVPHGGRRRLSNWRRSRGDYLFWRELSRQLL